jgi:hypothetical protein
MIPPRDLKWETLCLLAQELAEQTSEFFEKKGPGKGDHATAAFVRSLRKAASETFGTDFSEKTVCSTAGMRFDYYFPDEAVAVEFAFGLHNPISEFERDVFKGLLAIEDGCVLKRLILMGKPGAIARLNAPAACAIKALVANRFQLCVEVLELRNAALEANRTEPGQNASSPHKSPHSGKIAPAGESS